MREQGVICQLQVRVLWLRLELLLVSLFMLLRTKQQGDGSWSTSAGVVEFRGGITSLAVMALINCDVPVKSPEVQRGLDYLRNLPPGGVGGLAEIYETSLAVMALCAAEEYDRDLLRIQLLARLIEESQERGGPAEGYWNYKIRKPGSSGGGDASNGQYAVLALRDAAYAGAQVSRETWERINVRAGLAVLFPWGAWTPRTIRRRRGSHRHRFGDHRTRGRSTISVPPFACVYEGGRVGRGC